MGTYRKRIEAASVYDVAIQSPLEAAPQLVAMQRQIVLEKCAVEAPAAHPGGTSSARPKARLAASAA